MEKEKEPEVVVYSVTNAAINTMLLSRDDSTVIVLNNQWYDQFTASAGFWP